MSKRYGLPFMGSKNKLAERIVDLLPSAGHLYDVFAGGCAQFERTCTMGPTNKKEIEKVFMPKHQVDEYLKNSNKQLDLFE